MIKYGYEFWNVYEISDTAKRSKKIDMVQKAITTLTSEEKLFNRIG